MLWKIGSSLRKSTRVPTGTASTRGTNVLPRWLITLPRAGDGRGVSPAARVSHTTAPPGPSAPPPATVPLTDTPAGAAGAGRGGLGRDRRLGGRRERRAAGARARFVGQRPDRLFDLGIERADAQQRLPFRGRRREVAAVPGQLAARQQVEDQVLPLGHRLDRQILRRAHRQRQRQLFAQPGPSLGCGRGCDGRHRGQAQKDAQVSCAAHRQKLYTTELVKTLLATVGAPDSSRLSRYSAFNSTLSHRSKRTPPVKRSTVMGVNP